METKTAVELIEAAIKSKGSEAKLAAAAGCSQNAIWAAKRAGRVSAELATKIEAATDGEFPRWKLRPDLWPAPDAEPSDKRVSA